MGIFTGKRPRAAAEIVWRPASPEIETAPGYAMDDDGCAGEHAYGATFILASAPGATITIWAYPSFAAPDAPGDFRTGYRCECRAAPDRDQAGPWTWVQYGQDFVYYDSLDRAGDGARAVAQALAAGADPAALLVPGEFWDWDGASW